VNVKRIALRATLLSILIKNILKIVSEAIDIRTEMFYSALSREEVNDGSILHEVSYQEGNEESKGYHDEKR
jgi:hypothetical protein